MPERPEHATIAAQESYITYVDKSPVAPKLANSNTNVRVHVWCAVVIACSSFGFGIAAFALALVDHLRR